MSKYQEDLDWIGKQTFNANGGMFPHTIPIKKTDSYKSLQSLINEHANMVEMLEVNRNDYQTDLRWVIEQLEKSKITAQQEVKYELRKELYNNFIADITKVLEGKINE
jgi:CHAT domain-containing protein